MPDVRKAVVVTRYLLLAVAILTGAYAIAAWMFGLLTDAGVAGATSAAAVLMAECITFSQQRGRMLRYREQVWARREADVTWMPARQLDDAPNLRGLAEHPRCVWDFGNGAPE